MEESVHPIGSALRSTGVTADHLTATGLVVAAVAAVAIGSGHLVLGVVLGVASALPDVLDGAVAKASATASPRGAFFDSVADRVSDTLFLGGVTWYLATRHHGAIAVLPFAVAGASTLVSYERARAESLGFNARGGLMERAERLVMLGIGLLFSRILIPVLWIMLVLTLITAGHRFVMVWRQASSPRAGQGRLARWRGAAGDDESEGEGTGPGARWRSRRETPARPRSWRRGAGTRP